ncbi:aspartyl protease [Scytonema hofmannii FACHB-248]|uniref:Aspartyl protease n=1 Tax=Scytonema hofmannii FACHB-248 TaxID=1842502 RepID=A0ABR8GWV3_9CYAN|nr:MULTISPECIES: aspartyl protease [Nostocales]MBD2607672.1 aspartyl protease [Scytonema hofmannii FACHB-248]
MISGEFNSQGELVFEISLITADKDVIPVNTLLDTGFTGWLAIDNQDALSLGWTIKINEQRDMQTAQGEARFNLYEGTVLLDGEEFIIEVLGGDELQDILLGIRWLQTKRLVADFPAGVLTLG